jgi:MFS family permease
LRLAVNGLSFRLGRPADIPVAIWIIGVVSLLMDLSSEMIHSLLPVYLVSVLATSSLAVGFIEGIAEATASITKVFSGALSDWLGKRQLLAALGYGIAAATKPVFPLAPSVGWLVAARFVDRIGKGIRGAPRDALVADLAPAGLRGASFGLRQSLDTVGAFLGPAVAIGLMWLTAGNFRIVFWIAVIPAVLAFALIALAVRDPAPTPGAGAHQPRAPLSLAETGRLGRAYWWIVGIATLATLGRFSEAFLILKAQAVGLAVFLVPLVLVVMNVAYALTSYPAGALSDRIGRTALLAAGFAVLIVADVILAITARVSGVAIGVILWGTHMGLTQGLLASLVADTAPADLRGTAFGVFNLFAGVALLVASVAAGALWDRFGPSMTFAFGAALTAAALAGLIAIRPRLRMS